jgi:hypothetical protein
MTETTMKITAKEREADAVLENFIHRLVMARKMTYKECFEHLGERQCTGMKESYASLTTGASTSSQEKDQKQQKDNTSQKPKT